MRSFWLHRPDVTLTRVAKLDCPAQLGEIGAR
jgi:hypothetical protein